MSEKRFIVETVEIIDCDTDESRIAKVITDTNELYSYDDLYELCDDLNKLAEENEQLRMKLKGDDYIMVSEMLSNLRKTGICDGCKNKDKPVEWYLERGFSITGQICDRYEPE